MQLARTVTFRPAFALGLPVTQRVNAATSPQQVALLSSGEDLLLQNVGSEIAELRWGDANVLPATEGDFILPPGTSVIVSRMGATHISVATLAGTTTVYITAGTGG